MMAKNFIISIDLPNTTGITVVVIFYTREEENSCSLFMHNIRKRIYLDRPTNLITVVKSIISLETAQLRRGVYFAIKHFFYETNYFNVK